MFINCILRDLSIGGVVNDQLNVFNAVYMLCSDKYKIQYLMIPPDIYLSVYYLEKLSAKSTGSSQE